MAGGGGAETTLEYTPSWVVAIVCTFIVAISFGVERLLHVLGKYLKKKKQKSLNEALQKIKEELMLLGFISLLLTVFQSRINTICIARKVSEEWLPCKKKSSSEDEDAAKTTAHFLTSFVYGSPIGRRLLAESSGATDYCSKQEGDKVPLLSATALHHLHIFIFALAVSHVTFCVLTIAFGGIKIHWWKHWEDSILKEENDRDQESTQNKFTHVQDHVFIRKHYRGIGKHSALRGWVHAFFKQFYASVTKSDYTTLRLGFIRTHCRGNPTFNFHKYMIRALEDDFKKVVGISWYLWLFVVVFLLLNVHGWYAYFWIAFVPFILLLAVGTKLEHVITQLAYEVAEKHVALEGDLVVKPSDEHFWFNRPRLVLILIHLILFQNSFEIAFFFWIWAQYSFDSCIMGKVGLIIPRLIIGVFVQFLCSYSTLPLYAIVTQMGTSYKKAIFEDHIQEGLVGWAQKARNKGLRKAANNGSSQVGPKESVSASIQMAKAGDKESAMEEGNAGGEIEPATVSDTHK